MNTTVGLCFTVDLYYTPAELVYYPLWFFLKKRVYSRSIMSEQLISQLRKDCAESPSPSDADTALAHQLLDIAAREPSTICPQSLIHCILAWQTKRLPRHLIDSSGATHPDTFSAQWSPGFYRLHLAMNQLQERLQGSTVLDPFAGSGSMMNTLMALDIPESVTLNDIGYIPGSPIGSINGKSFYYHPQANRDEYTHLFSQYQASIPMPNFDKVEDCTSADVGEGLPFKNNAFDWVFTDPPYGRALGQVGVERFLHYLPEILRVSRNGALLLIPECWLAIIDETGTYAVENLTGTLAHKRTTFKTVVALVQ